MPVYTQATVVINWCLFMELMYKVCALVSISIKHFAFCWTKLKMVYQVRISSGGDAYLPQVKPYFTRLCFSSGALVSHLWEWYTTWKPSMNSVGLTMSPYCWDSSSYLVTCCV